MPKHTIKHASGTSLSEGIRSMLGTFFSKEEINKLEILGGTVEVVISTTPRGIKKKKGQMIDQNYIRKLRNTAGSGGDLKAELMTLTGKQLREVCVRIELPSSSHLTNRQLVASIESRLLSPRRWNYIIEHASQD